MALYYYQFYQFGTGGSAQWAKPVQGANPKPWECRMYNQQQINQSSTTTTDYANHV